MCGVTLEKEVVFRERLLSYLSAGVILQKKRRVGRESGGDTLTVRRGLEERVVRMSPLSIVGAHST